MGQYRPLFVYFSYFLDTISIMQIEKSLDGVLGIRTWGHRMVGADETTELWRPLCLLTSNKLKLHWSIYEPSCCNGKKFESYCCPRLLMEQQPFLEKPVMHRLLVTTMSRCNILDSSRSWTMPRIIRACERTRDFSSQ